jgi:hypothetical protein
VNPKLLEKRGALIAISAAVVSFVLAFLGLACLYWFLRPFVWAAVYGVAYSPPVGPYPPNSGEWLFVQGIGFFSSAGAGFAAARWSRPGSWRVWVALALASLLLVLASDFPVGISTARTVLFVLQAPLGVVFGALLYLRSRRHVAVELLTRPVDGELRPKSRFPRKSLVFLALSLIFTYTVIVYFNVKEGHLLFHALVRSGWVIAMFAVPFTLGTIAWLIAANIWRSKAILVFHKVVQVVCIALGTWVFAVGVFGLSKETRSIGTEQHGQLRGVKTVTVGGVVGM